MAVASELAGIAQAALETLPPHYREVLRMAREEQLPMREIAERTSRSREAVKKLYGRALSQFTQEFERLKGESVA